MSHCTIAYDKKGKEVDCIIYGAFSNNYNLIYEALDSKYFNNGASGNGMEKKFSKEDILSSIEFCENISISEVYPDEEKLEKRKLKKFLKKCLTVANREGSVNILFG